MNLVITLQSEILKAIGMSMIHSVWQGAIVLLPVLLVLALIRKEKAGLRYVVLYAGLMTMLFLFVYTFLRLYNPATTIEAGGMTLTSGMSSTMQYTGSPYTVPDPGSAGAGLIAKALDLLYASAPLLALIWIAGFLVTGARLATGMYTSQAFVRRRTFKPEQQLLEIFSKVSRLMNVPVATRLKMSAKRISPMVSGIIKPVVVIPVAALSNLSTTQVEAILAHEIAHVRRYDHIFLLLQEIAKGILFFHPLTWYLCSGINKEREHCCDDLVMKTYANPIDYIKALAMIQEMNLAGIQSASAITGRPNRLLNRIRRLILPQSRNVFFPKLATMFVLLLSAGVLLGTTFKKPEKQANEAGPTSSLSALSAFGNPPEDSNHVEVMVSINADGTRQDTTIVMVSKRVRLDGQESGDEMNEIMVRMSNDSIREITVNGKTVPPEDYSLYADTVKSLRLRMTSPEGKQSIIVVNDSVYPGHNQVRKEIKVIVNGRPSENLDKEIDSLIKGINHDKEIEIIIRDAGSAGLYSIMQEDLMADLYLSRDNLLPYLQHLKTLQADSIYNNQAHKLLQLYQIIQPDTGIYNETFRQQYFEQMEKMQVETQLAAEDIRKMQEKARQVAEEMRQQYEETARRAAAQAREQSEQAREQSEQARQRADQAREQMERSRAEQEAARQQYFEQYKNIQEEMLEKQQEMQDLMKEFREQLGDSLFLYLPSPGEPEAFIMPFSDSTFVFPLPSVPEVSIFELPPVPRTGEPFYYALPEISNPGEHFNFYLPEISNDDASISDPERMEEMNSTLKDLEK